MKVYQLHNKYQIRGGEDSVVESEFELLKSRGIEVVQRFVDNSSIDGFLSKVGASLRLRYSKKSFEMVKGDVLKYKPDVVHVHNTFPLLTPSVYDACRESGVPVVQTLHNYRFICPTSLLMHKGQADERSIYNSAYWAVPYRVYKRSYIATLLLANMIEFHKKRKTFHDKVNRFICLTEFSKEKFVQAGFPEGKVLVKPNFVDIPAGFPDIRAARKKRYAVFVGRLSVEKGIDVLLKAWAGVEFDLKIIGEGSALKTGLRHVEFLGRLKRSDVLDYIRNALFVVVPSRCYEGFPMAIAEAFGCGTAVLCSRLGSMEEIVKENVTGLLFEPGSSEDLKNKANWMIANQDQVHKMSCQARRKYEREYTPDENFKILLGVYNQAIDDMKSSYD